MSEQESVERDPAAENEDEGADVEAHKRRLADEPADDDNEPDVEAHKRR